MQWIEIIQLRTAGEAAGRDLADELGRSLQDQRATVTVYRHAAIGTDLSVHMMHETKGHADPDCSLGLRLAATLGEHGLVTRALWARVEPSRTKRRQS